MWAVSSNLLYFIIARFIGGISKGNVSLSMAIITDISSAKTRGRGMVCFKTLFDFTEVIHLFIFRRWLASPSP